MKIIEFFTIWLLFDLIVNSQGTTKDSQTQISLLTLEEVKSLVTVSHIDNQISQLNEIYEDILSEISRKTVPNDQALAKWTQFELEHNHKMNIFAKARQKLVQFNHKNFKTIEGIKNLRIQDKKAVMSYLDVLKDKVQSAFYDLSYRLMNLEGREMALFDEFKRRHDRSSERSIEKQEKESVNFETSSNDAQDYSLL